ncbi:MAG: hypothetical protein NC112_08365 [Oxalobacter formigenes]|nr:hypothetical protein [Oxalobacter formigenes]
MRGSPFLRVIGFAWLAKTGQAGALGPVFYATRHERRDIDLGKKEGREAAGLVGRGVFSVWHDWPGFGVLSLKNA